MSTASSRTPEEVGTEMDRHATSGLQPALRSRQPLRENDERQEAPKQGEPAQLTSRTLRRLQRVMVSCSTGGSEGQSSGPDTTRAENGASNGDVPLARNRESTTNLSAASVESMCGSTVMPNILNRKNLDFFSAQMLGGGMRLRPEFLCGENVRPHGDENSEFATAELPMSLWTECGGSEHLSHFISLSDMGINADDERAINANDSLSEETNPRTPVNDDGALSTAVEMGTLHSNSRVLGSVMSPEDPVHSK
uniref:Uncharacterized protein n=1 Tax=Trypanosoma congolense (strain IL3000) TaxID=1068625 RepID=G0ULC2_TRYCI|nr:conserved hypothetical protein [Trypanosoma congolense IL3000]